MAEPEPYPTCKSLFPRQLKRSMAKLTVLYCFLSARARLYNDYRTKEIVTVRYGTIQMKWKNKLYTGFTSIYLYTGFTSISLIFKPNTQLLSLSIYLNYTRKLNPIIDPQIKPCP